MIFVLLLEINFVVVGILLLLKIGKCHSHDSRTFFSTIQVSDQQRLTSSSAWDISQSYTDSPCPECPILSGPTSVLLLASTSCHLWFPPWTPSLPPKDFSHRTSDGSSFPRQLHQVASTRTHLFHFRTAIMT